MSCFSVPVQLQLFLLLFFWKIKSLVSQAPSYTPELMLECVMVSWSVPATVKHAQTMTFSPPCFIVGMRFLSCNALWHPKMKFWACLLLKSRSRSSDLYARALVCHLFSWSAATIKVLHLLYSYTLS